MFGTKGKKGLRGQVEDIAEDLADRISPHVDNAREQLAPLLADARDKAGPAVAAAATGAVVKATPYVKEARDRFNDDVVPAVTAAVADARDKATPYLEDARDKAAPYVQEARDEATRRGRATAAALKGEVDPPKKGGKLKKVLLAGGVIGLGAFVVSKLKAKDAGDGWQSSYVPPAPPAPAPKPTPAPAAPVDDVAGASPDEAVADAVEAPHAVTTPDEPVEEIKVDKPPAPPAS